MSEYEKLEYIHHVIQECMSQNNSTTPYMLETALEFVEDIREPFFISRIRYSNDAGVADL